MEREPITVDEVGAELLTGVSRHTFRKMRQVGGGPDVVRVGRRVLYEVQELRRWLTSLSSARMQRSRTGRA